MRVETSWILLLLIFLLIVPGLFWGLPSAITPQVDAPLPMGPLFFFAQYGQPHVDTVYPAFHQLLLAPVYAAALILYGVLGGISHISSAWPYGLKDTSLFFSYLIVLGNLVSACMGIAILYVAIRLAEDHKRWAWAGLLLVGVNSVFIYYSRVGNLDIPYNFWWAISLFFLWRYFIGEKTMRASLLPAAIASACAVGSKDQAVGLVIGAGVLVLLLSSGKAQPFALRFRHAVFFTAVLLACYTVVAILPNPARWWYHARFVVSDHAPTSIPLSPRGEVEIFGVTIRQLFTVFGIPVLLLSVAGAAFLARSRRLKELWILCVPLISYYCVIIAKTRVMYPRFTLPFFLSVLILTIHGAAWIGEHIFSKRPARLAWIALLGALIVFRFAVSYVPVTYAQVFDLKRRVAAELPGVLPPGSPVLLSHMQTYNYPNRRIYESYALMRLPQDPVQPASRHAASIFKPLDENVRYYLLGSGNAGLPWNPVGEYPPLVGTLVREWRYPEWVKRSVVVPCIYEFALYRRTAPLPLERAASGRVAPYPPVAGWGPTAPGWRQGR